MSALAQIALNLGAVVSGSDLVQNEQTEALKKKGASIFVGHDKHNVYDAEYVIYSSAIKGDNPEFLRARKMGALLLSRAEFLAEIAKEYECVIAISGCHGKTTTTGMVAKMLIDAGLNPTVHIGGELDFLGGNVRIGDNKFFVTEACEFMGNFLYLSPTISVILNVGADHLDYYKTFDNVKRAFYAFSKRTQKDGFIVYNYDSKDICLPTNISKIGFSMENKGQVYACNISCNNEGKFSFMPIIDGAVKGRVFLNIFGKHNIYNALACIAIGNILKIPYQTMQQSLNGFGGARRRFEKMGNLNGAEIIIDYAHHPDEIKSSIETARIFTKNEVVAIFQSHTYSRTAALFDEFIRAFWGADKVAFYPIFPAREQPMPGITHKALCERCKEFMDAVSVDDDSELLNYIYANAKAGNTILLLGAGDYIKVCDKIKFE
ncbi:MAG: UDP-N-acetylmuramate--L-alanine ligase [Clostridia bacterium]|nr:UDP-N-acetylmuramate--L-alanine ligase [Clostridia bacterium]